MMEQPWIPTVDDLRVRCIYHAHNYSLTKRMQVQVKMCYICREEEHHDRTSPTPSIIQLKS